MIVYDRNTGSFYLETRRSSYVMRVLDDGTLTHCYYGAAIPREDLSFLTPVQNLNFSPRIRVDGRSVSPEAVAHECPTFGRGDFRTPALQVEGADGTRVNELTYVSHRIADGAAVIPGLPAADRGGETAQTLEITLADRAAGFEATLVYTVFPEEDVIARHTVLHSTADVPLTVLRLPCASLDFPDGDFDMISLQGAWARERHVERYPLHHGISEISSRRGASSHQLNPFAALVGRHTDEDRGEAYGMALVYSGDFRILAEVDQMGGVRFTGGMNPETFGWVLEPGQTLASPQAWLTYSAEGLNRMSQNFHAACRRHLGKCAEPNLHHPILINSWEAMYFDFDEEKMLRFIRDCAGLGLDTVVMDDGWFGHRDTDNSSLGDWTIYRKKLPGGLTRIIDECRKNGMHFGIWFEPEMISRDSDLYRAHPDWCVHTPDRPCIEARQQLVLDMSRPEVVDEIYRQMAAILDEYDISYVKWDMNRHITDNGSARLAGRQGEFAHRYLLGVYDLMDRLTKAYPRVFFEGCSGGGGRFDFGILYYMPQIWTSDDSDAAERLKIQYGTSFAYPPSAMVAHVSACPNHQTGRTTPFATRGHVAQMCSFGYEFDVGKLTAEEKAQIRDQIVRHRAMEDLVDRGTFYRLRSPFETDFCAWELVAEDRKRAWAMFAFRAVSPHPAVQYLRLRGLDPDTRYTVVQLGITACGSVLMNAGIPVSQPFEDYAALAFDLIAES